MKKVFIIMLVLVVAGFLVYLANEKWGTKKDADGNVIDPNATLDPNATSTVNGATLIDTISGTTSLSDTGVVNPVVQGGPSLP